MKGFSEQWLAERRSHQVDVSQPPFALPADNEPVTITLAEPPQGKGRARAFTKKDGSIGHHTPDRTRLYEARIATAANEAMRKRRTLHGPLELILRAVYPIPKKFSKADRDRAIVGEIMPTCKPDLDNVIKAWKDALNTIVYPDDAMVTDVTARKRYGPQPLVVVTVRPLA